MLLRIPIVVISPLSFSMPGPYIGHVVFKTLGKRCNIFQICQQNLIEVFEKSKVQFLRFQRRLQVLGYCFHRFVALEGIFSTVYVVVKMFLAIDCFFIQNNLHNSLFLLSFLLH